MPVESLFHCRWALLLASILGVMGCGKGKPDGSAVDQAGDSTQAVQGDPIQSIRRAVLRRQFQSAESLIQERLLVDPADVEVLELAGDLSAQVGDPGKSIRFYRQAIDAHAQDAGRPKPSMKLLDKLGQQCINAGRPFDSIDVLNQAVEFYPSDPIVRQKLLGLQVSVGLEREAAEHLQWLVQRQHGNVGLLVILSDLSRPQTVKSTCEYALEQSPSDLRPQYSLARIPAYHGQWKEVLEDLRQVVAVHPSFAEAVALFGRALVENAEFKTLETWSEDLPSDIDSHPEYWMAMGIFAERQQQTAEAIFAFQRVVMLDPNHGEALTRLSAIFGEEGRTELAKRAAERASLVNQLRANVDSLLSWNNNSQAAAVKIAVTLEKLGRQWEAVAWLQAAYAMTQNMEEQLPALFTSMRDKLTSQTPWQDLGFRAGLEASLRESGSFNWRVSPGETTASAVSGANRSIRFVDEALSRELLHSCKIASKGGKESGLGIYQSGAGGAGVIDFDLDGWADLYLTAMDGTPGKEDSSENRLHRNLEGRFEDQTNGCGAGDPGFAQGVACGDYDSDGFPDLFVANIGKNRLYRNNGDGTFTEVSLSVGLSGSDWTTSVAMSDLDGDGHCDLFEVGYCAGEDVLTRECVEVEVDEPRSCSPLAFSAQGDRIWRGDGSGGFVDVSSSWLGEHEPGRGMGIVIGQFDQQPGLDLYVANDMTANHLWVGSGDPDFQFSEQATLRGVAFNKRSLSQASMGIAVGDADQDSDVDFFVTHFSADHNTYYEQVSDGLWSDQSDASGLAEPSQSLLAYGTQWVDVDADGDLELFVANGDIDDFTHKGRSYRQPFEVFHRQGNAVWDRLIASDLGEYFTRKHLARAIAVLDANRDRQADLVVTHLFEPVALLINQTSEVGNSVRFQLKGRQSHRDAVGVRIQCRVGPVKREMQLFAGDGYHCSNQREIVFGVSDADSITDVVVLWPDGSSDELGDLPTNQNYLLVQGASDAFEMGR